MLLPKITVCTPSIRPEGLALTQASLQSQTFQDFEWLVEIGLPPAHDLNAAYNRMLRRAKGELVVSLQDFIRLEKDGLQKFWDAYQEFPDTFFTAPVGKTLDWTEIKWDWRDSDAVMEWNRWEIDWGAAPLKALKAIGGFDEALDEYWSSDNVSVAHRANLNGYKFMNLRENKAVAFDHDEVIKHPFRDRYNPAFNNERMQQVERKEINLEL